MPGSSLEAECGAEAGQSLEASISWCLGDVRGEGALPPENLISELGTEVLMPQSRWGAELAAAPRPLVSSCADWALAPFSQAGLIFFLFRYGNAAAEGLNVAERLMQEHRQLPSHR